MNKELRQITYPFHAVTTALSHSGTPQQLRQNLQNNHHMYCVRGYDE